MRILIAAIGRAPKDAEEAALASTYLSRAEAPGMRLGLGPFSLREIDERRAQSSSADIAQRKQREGDMLLAQIPEGAHLVALDGGGREMSSMQFAQWLGRIRDQGCRDMAFVIGGADGHGDQLIARAQTRLSLGAMTWPHMLVRAMLAEQIYRAVTILANHPYHRA